jgi:hypothetical protein
MALSGCRISSSLTTPWHLPELSVLSALPVFPYVRREPRLRSLREETHMRRIFLFLVVGAAVPFLSVRADDQGPVQKTTNTVKKVAGKTSDTIANGAKATGRTISNGAKATGNTIYNGAKKAGRTMGKGLHKAGNTVRSARNGSNSGQG